MTLAFLAKGTGLRCIGRPNGRLTQHIVPRRRPEDAIGSSPSTRLTDAQDTAVQSLRTHGYQATRDYYEQSGRLLTSSNERNFRPAPKPRERYGMKGITRKGRDTLESGAFLMERLYGKEHLAFVTLTVPELPIGEQHEVHTNFSKILALFTDWFRKRCQRAGIPEDWLYAVEVQETRFETTGLPILHVHFLAVGRKRRSTWFLSHADWQSAWRRALAKFAPSVGRPRVECAPVKKSAEGYLGKYLSKGSAAVQSVVDAGYRDWLPKQWWGCSRSLKSKVASATEILADPPQELISVFEATDRRIWAYRHPIKIGSGPNDEIVVAISGKLSADAKRAFRRDGFMGLIQFSASLSSSPLEQLIG